VKKTTSAAIAAFVVTVAASAASLMSSSASVGSGADVASSPPLVSVTGAAADGGPRATDPSTRRRRTVLVVGRSPELSPRGGVTTSFVWRAAARLGWTCQIRQGPAPVIPANVGAAVVVVVLVPGDDVAKVTKVLARVKAGAWGARLILLGPMKATANPAAARRLAGLRQLATARGGEFVDPVEDGWISASTRGTYLTRDGGQLTTAGRAMAAERLARALDRRLAPTQGASTGHP
jgi:hypothetical protein